MNVVLIIWIVLQFLIGYNLVLPFLIKFIALCSQKVKVEQNIDAVEVDYAIIVTAYEQTNLLPAVVDSLLKLNYENYCIYIVADKCDVTNLYFNSDKVVLLRPKKTLGSNTRSHFYAIERFIRKHERLTIIDSDNQVAPNYLNALNKYFDYGFEAVQGLRAAKNLNTSYACLDAARDIYYHYYDGNLLFQAGSSATLAGSGMAFNANLYKDCLKDLDIVGAGFDKVLQFEIVKRNNRIAFAEDAIVYDEKTTKSDQLVKQRARWINTWFKYFYFGFSLIRKGLITGSKNQALFGIVLLRPPLFIFLLMSLVCFIINFFISYIVALVWFIGLLIFVLGFYNALLNSRADERIYKSLKGIPAFIFFQLLSLTKVRKANKISVSTTHYTASKE